MHSKSSLDEYPHEEDCLIPLALACAQAADEAQGK